LGASRGLCDSSAVLYNSAVAVRWANQGWAELEIFLKTRMRGKAQPDGRPAVELIETLVLFSLIVAKVHVQRRLSINNILLQ